MAEQEVWVGSVGPFVFDDEEDYPNEAGVKQVGLRTQSVIEVSNVQTTALTENVRLLFSTAQKEVDEVNDLTDWITGTDGIEVSGSNGTVEIGLGNTPLKLPSLTTTERDNLSDPEISIIYNSTEERIEYYDGDNWYYINGTQV